MSQISNITSYSSPRHYKHLEIMTIVWQIREEITNSVSCVVFKCTAGCCAQSYDQFLYEWTTQPASWRFG